jgi:hypothetical protein
LNPEQFFYTHNPNGLFGREELGEREVEAREIEEKWSISPVWQREEIGERDIKHVGPTVF